jgi:hypothetical protein
MKKSWEDFYAKVRAMRRFQVEYFKRRDPTALREAKKLEADVDRMIKDREERLGTKDQGILFRED